MDLFNEISELAYSTSCTNSSIWRFIAYGSKACGGPQGHLPYSNQINVKTFLEKIESYTEAEKEYNLKWGIISDCAAIASPNSVECKNGYPILKY